MQLDSNLSILALQHIKGVGPSRLAQLLAHFKTPQAILSASRQDMANLGESKLLMALSDELAGIQDRQHNHPLIQAAEREIEYCSSHDIQILTIDNEAFPNRLKQISAPPSLLYIKGDRDVLNRPQLSIVGARNASTEGLRNASVWAYELASAGLIITSGLAEGIDGAAHQGALNADKQTIAVLAHGLDRLYPRVHKALSENIIAKGGALVSEFAIGTPPKREYFPRRNRIISGLSLGVCVIEAAIKSGSLITARFAVEQNREVFALPSHIQNVMAEGCHYLIKQGAELVTHPEQIVQTLQQQYQFEAEVFEVKDSSLLSSDQIPANIIEDTSCQLINAVPFSPIHFDELTTISHLAPQALSAQLVLLEMQGKIAVESGFYRRIT